MSEWVETTLGAVLRSVDERQGERPVPLVLSVTEKRGIIPQDEVFKKRVATEDTSKYKVLEPLDIAYNPYLLWTGAVGQWLGTEAGVTSPVYETFRADTAHDARYVGLVLESGLLTPYFDSTAIGSIQRRRRTPVPVFLEARVSMPSIEEQRRIVDVIEAVDSHIAALEAETQAAVAYLAASRADFPAGQECCIDEVLVGIDSGKSVMTSGDAPSVGQPRILKLSAVGPGRFDASEAKFVNDPTGFRDGHLVQDGDLLITRSNTPERVGYCAVARDVPEMTYMPDLIWRLRVDEVRCRPAYLEHLLASEEMRARVTSTASGTNSSMRKINKRGFATVSVPMPPLADQDHYVTMCEASADVANRLLREVASIRAFRSNLLTVLLSREHTIPESYDSMLDAVS